MVEDFVDKRGTLLPADELELLHEWAAVRVGAYEVVAIDRGEGLALVDHRTGDRVELADRSMSRTLEVEDLLFAWLVPGPDGLEPMPGGIVVPDHARRSLLDLVDADPDAYEVAAWYAQLTAPPGLANREGHPMVVSTIIYEVADPEDAAAELAMELEDQGDGLFVQHFLTDDTGEEMIRGTVRLDGHELTIETNSRERAEDLRDLVEGLLPFAVLVDEEYQPIEELLAERAAAGGGDESPSGAIDPESLSPEGRAALTEALNQKMTEYEDAWLDTPIPALDGATPREAVEDPTRRGDVERLLRRMPPADAGGPSFGRGMDPDRLRELLGL